jgi:hypothetical protein
MNDYPGNEAYQRMADMVADVHARAKERGR